MATNLANIRALLDEVYWRLVDATWLKRSDLKESLEQMHRGEGTVRRPRARPDEGGPGR